ncbi:MAG TPA: hypothetical protein DCM40_44800, partial [Maribacter sp.]|nr:hypothetical protein [Maribacter sp.]
PGGPSKPAVLPSKKGYNRFTWDFKRDPLPAVEKVFVLGGLDGSIVGPGDYQLRLTLENETAETSVSILPLPNIEATKADYEEQQNMLKTIEATVIEIHTAV